MKAEEMKAAAEKKLFIGRKVKVFQFAKDKDRETILRRRKTGTVAALYPYIFTVDFGRYKESFRYSQLFEDGMEVVRL